MATKPPATAYQHIYPVVNLLVERAVNECHESDMPITCGKGCSHCCYILVEAFWEEAEHMVQWLAQQSTAKRQDFIRRIQHNVTRYNEFCQKKRSRQKFIGVLNNDDPELSDNICNDYFYKHRQPCPFLRQSDGACQAYDARPTSCRLHLVSSDPSFCAVDAADDVDAEVPERIDEELSNDVGAINDAVALDGRRGHLSTLIMANIKEHFPQWLSA